MEGSNAACTFFSHLHTSAFLFSENPGLLRMGSFGRDLLMQRRLPVQHLFDNNNHQQQMTPSHNYRQQGLPIQNVQLPTDKIYQTTSSKNYQMNQSYRQQTSKNYQQPSPSRISQGSKKHLSTIVVILVSPDLMDDEYNIILFFCQISSDSPSLSGNKKTSALLASKELHERLQKQGFCYF